MELDNHEETLRLSDNFKSLLFGLSFYHAACLERRKFGGIGWNISYEWMQSDFRTALAQLRMYVDSESVPFSTIYAMIGDIVYGGRVTDSWDQRTNLALLQRFMCPDILTPNFMVTKGYEVPPPTNSLKHLLAHVENFPLTDHPHLFGLHENAEAIFQSKISKELLSSLISLQPQRITNSANSMDSAEEDVISALASRVPSLIDASKAHPTAHGLTKEGHLNSLGVVCEHEVLRYNNLLSVISNSLESLQSALKGLVVMSPSLEQIYSDIYINKVPKLWRDAGYPSLKSLGSWCDDLDKRVEAIRSWLQFGTPKAFWISGFMFPQGFITGMLQLHSRKTKIPIDILSVRTTILASGYDIKNSPSHGVYIYGLYLEGARWDGVVGTLSESLPRVLFDELPFIWLEPSSTKSEDDRELFECPVYKTRERAGELSTTGLSTNYILSLFLPTKSHSKNHWVCNGVAAICAIDI
jgi:dynein heavy chain